MSYIPPPGRGRTQHNAQPSYATVISSNSQHAQYPNNSPYFQQPPQQHLPQAVNQRSLSHSSNPSPQLQSNNIPPSHETNLFYQLQQHASQSPNSPATNQQQQQQQQPPPQTSQQRQPTAPILPPSRNGARNTPVNGQVLVPNPVQINPPVAQETPERPANNSQSPAPRHILNDVSPAPTQIPNLTTETMIPPPEATYATFDELMHFANQHAFAHGYALVIARSKKKGAKDFKKVLIACDRWGPVQHSGLRPEHLRKRNTTSKKTDCKFGFHAIETATEWKLMYRQEAISQRHNHGPSNDMSKHAAARKLNGAAMQAIKAYSDAGLSVKETVEQIQIAQPGAMVIARDVYNARALLKREPAKFPHVESNMMPPIVTRPNLSPEEKIRDECRVEVSKAKDETDAARREIDELKKQLAEKDKMIEKFEMFIDICNQRVMVQRERLTADEGGEVSRGSASNT